MGPTHPQNFLQMEVHIIEKLIHVFIVSIDLCQIVWTTFLPVFLSTQRASAPRFRRSFGQCAPPKKQPSIVLLSFDSVVAQRGTRCEKKVKSVKSVFFFPSFSRVQSVDIVI